MTESELLAAVRRLCDRHGVWHYHPAPAPVAPHERGFPDLVLVGTERGAFRELKVDGGRVSSEQWSVGCRMRSSGWDWGVWRPIDLESGRVEAEIAALSGRVPWGVKPATARQVGFLAGEVTRLYGVRESRLKAASAVLGRDVPSFKTLTREDAGRLFTWLARGGAGADDPSAVDEEVAATQAAAEEELPAEEPAEPNGQPGTGAGPVALVLLVIAVARELRSTIARGLPQEPTGDDA